MKVRDWESHEGRHSGGYVLDELQQIVQSRIDIELSQVNHMVSIVVPVLNEEATIEQLQAALPKPVDPRLVHYLERKSYDKALEYLEGRDD